MLQTFLSSKMRRNVLAPEREAACRAIEATEVCWCWRWEDYATAGSYPPMDRCLDEVKRSDTLVLILGRDLTSHTQQEYELAKQRGIHRYVFVKEGQLLAHTRSFLAAIQSDVTYQKFGNAGELETMVKKSLQTDMARAFRSLVGRHLLTPLSSASVIPHRTRAV